MNELTFLEKLKFTVAAITFLSYSIMWEIANQIEKLINITKNSDSNNLEQIEFLVFYFLIIKQKINTKPIGDRMGTISLMHAKLHRVTVTKADVNYMGSITMDRELLKIVGILPLEQVEIVNLTNGNRWTTYALYGKSNSGCIEANGGGALLCKPGDLLIIYAMETKSRESVLNNGQVAKVVFADEKNGCEKFVTQKAILIDDEWVFQTTDSEAVTERYCSEYVSDIFS